MSTPAPSPLARVNCSGSTAVLGVAVWSDACLFGFACPLECKILLFIAAGAVLVLLIATLARCIGLCRERGEPPWGPSGAGPPPWDATPAAARARRVAFVFDAPRRRDE